MAHENIKIILFYFVFQYLFLILVYYNDEKNIKKINNFSWNVICSMKLNKQFYYFAVQKGKKKTHNGHWNIFLLWYHWFYKIKTGGENKNIENDVLL